MIKTLGSHAAGIPFTAAQFAAAPSAVLIALGAQENEHGRSEHSRPSAADPHEGARETSLTASLHHFAAAGAYNSKTSGAYATESELLRHTPPIAHVLVCDDETRLGDLTAGLLEECGFAAGFVPSAADAMDYLDAHHDTRVVLLDVNLSGRQSAYDLLSFLVARARPLRVVLTSGSSKQEVRGELTQHPLVVGYLEKPYAEEDLTAAITNALTA